MEGLRNFFQKVTSEDFKLGSISSSSIGKQSSSLSIGGSSSSALSSTDNSKLMLSRPYRHAVSPWTCSKLCAVCFVAGVVLGYTLKRRVRRWASKLLRRLKED